MGKSEIKFHFSLVFRINCLSDVRAACKSVPNLTKQQLDICYRANDVTLAAVEGLELAVRECEHQVSLYVLLSGNKLQFFK